MRPVPPFAVRAAGVKLTMRCICVMLGSVPPAVAEGKRLEEAELVKAYWDESVKVSWGRACKQHGGAHWVCLLGVLGVPAVLNL